MQKIKSIGATDVPHLNFNWINEKSIIRGRLLRGVFGLVKFIPSDQNINNFVKPN